MFNQERIAEQLEKDFNTLNNEMFRNGGRVQQIFVEELGRVTQLYINIGNMFQVSVGQSCSSTDGISKRFGLAGHTRTVRTSNIVDEVGSGLMKAGGPIWLLGLGGIFGLTNPIGWLTLAGAGLVALGIGTKAVGLVTDLVTDAISSKNAFKDTILRRLEGAAEALKEKLRQLEPELETMVRQIASNNF